MPIYVEVNLKIFSNITTILINPDKFSQI